jgi:hypothetical protein
MTPAVGAAMPTGPPSPAHSNIADLISHALDAPLTDEQMSPDLVRRALIADGLPQAAPDWVLVRLAGYVSSARTSQDRIAPEGQANPESGMTFKIFTEIRAGEGNHGVSDSDAARCGRARADGREHRPPPDA